MISKNRHEVYASEEYRAFVRSMREDVSDVARLACADYLQDRGEDERAEFIRDSASGVFMGLSHLDGSQQKWPLTRVQLLADRWFSVNSLAACVPLRWDGVINWRGVFGASENTGYVHCGFLYKIAAPVGFVLNALDLIYESEPVYRVEVTDWDTRGPDGHPIIQPEYYPSHLLKGNNSYYRVAGRIVSITPQESSEILLSRNIEKTRAELVFSRRYPGIVFEVNI